MINNIKKAYIAKIKGFKGNEVCAATCLFEGPKDLVSLQMTSMHKIAAKYQGLSGGAENGISQLQESPDGAEAPKHSTKSSFGGFGVRENSRLVEKKNYFLFCSFSRFVGGFQEKAEISYEYVVVVPVLYPFTL